MGVTCCHFLDFRRIVREVIGGEGEGEREKITWYSASPPIHLGLAEEAEKYFLEEEDEEKEEGVEEGEEQKRRKKEGKRRKNWPIRLIRNCSAALYPSLIKRMERIHGATVLPTYAMSECFPLCANVIGLWEKREYNFEGFFSVDYR